MHLELFLRHVSETYIHLQSLHISNAMQKLGVKGRSQAVVELLRMGELEL